MTQVFLFDIEGTTTDIHFVHKVLFPYSKDRMKEFILDHLTHPEVASAMDEIKKEVRREEHLQLTDYEVINRLEQWIEEDRKHGSLKTLQGLIWEEGYKKGDFKGHVYPDVKPFFEKIKASGKQIAIYSSGSVHAQKLIMAYSEAGDLTPLISNYFDTKVGPKRQTSSYQNIAHALKVPPSSIHFFSDIPEELAAAETASLSVTQLLRDGTAPSPFQAIHNFSAFKL